MQTHPSAAAWLGAAALLSLHAVAVQSRVADSQTTPTAARARTQAPAQTPPASRTEFFETNVRPVLAGTCYDCHADDPSAGLRVDSREALLKGGKSGPAIVPGDPEGSLLIQAVRQTGALKMPRGGKLTDSEISALVEWVRTGAEWPAAAPTTVTVREFDVTAEHRAFWSFQPLAAPSIPAVTDTSWPRTDIDRFVLARLERDGLRPVAAADKRTLIRRATLDLTGVPPTPDEIEAFEHDDGPEAFATVVDRLLASPRYGETWGRMWLDVARFGEDDYRSLDPMGRGHNPYPNAYLYRDWVIKAFNDDLPYDQFVRAQVAGDLLDAALRARTLPALGFLGLGPWYYDNGAVEITRADERHDRVDVVSRGFLGLTVGCARCHDHKYDPISAKDYYAMAGVFLNTAYREYPLVPKSVATAFDQQQKTIERKEKLLAEFLRTESTQLGETLALQSSKYMVAAWKVTGKPKEDMAAVADAQKLDYELFDRWIRFLAKPPTFYPFLAAWQTMVKGGGTEKEAKSLADEFQALLLEVMFDRRELQEENDIIKAKALPGTKKKEPAKKPNEFVTNDDFCPGCGLELKSLPLERMQLWTDVFQRDLQEGFDPAQAFDKVKPGLLVFRGWGLERQLSAERRRYIDDLRASIDNDRKALPAHYPFVHGVGEVDAPADLKVSIRGNPYRLGDEVPRRFLAVLSPGAPVPFANGSGRLELADAIVAQPIAMRVIVNRVWKGHFGTGIVDTPSNFGQTGERPTNPALLEHLAHWFADRRLSLKALHREIMLSAVYQLSSTHSAANFEKDSGNRLYWRANRRRMTAEQIRDSLLFVTGALSEKAGGPSVALTPFEDRRTVYGKVSRYKLDEYLQLFDFPSPNLSAEQRFTTNVPLQRLFFMNSDFMQRQGELLAARVSDEPDQPSRIRRAYRLVFGRSPDDVELQAGLDYLAAEPMRQYEERKAARTTVPNPASAESTQSDAPAGRNDEDNPADEPGKATMMAGVNGAESTAESRKKLPPVTTWGRYARVLLSSSEFLFVQ